MWNCTSMSYAIAVLYMIIMIYFLCTFGSSLLVFGLICFTIRLCVIRHRPRTNPRDWFKQKDPEERNSLCPTESIGCTTQSICEKSN